MIASRKSEKTQLSYEDRPYMVSVVILFSLLVLRLHLGQRGREVAQRNFTVESMVKSYERLWHEVMTKPQVPRLRVPQPRE